MRRVGVFTSGRWDYSYLFPVLQEFQSAGLDCFWFVLSDPNSEFSLFMKNRWLDNSFIVPLQDFSRGRQEMAESLAQMQIQLTEMLNSSDVDYAILLGDRAEIFSAASALFFLDIPFAHLAAGDITAGAIDDNFRFAISALADTHFAFSIDSYNLLLKTQMHSGGIYLSNPPQYLKMIENCQSNLQEISEITGLGELDSFILSTFHIETKSEVSVSDQIEYIRQLFTRILVETNIVVTAPNGDPGSEMLLNMLSDLAANNSRIKFFTQLGEPNYWKVLKSSLCLLGNSSSGIYEAPVLGVPVINIGRRQFGRKQSSNILNFDWKQEQITDVVDSIRRIASSEVGHGNLGQPLLSFDSVAQTLINRDRKDWNWHE